MRGITGAVVAAVPLVLGVWAAPLLADRLGVIAGAWVARAACAITADRARPPLVLADGPDSVEIETLSQPTVAAAATAGGHGATRPPVRRGIRVRASTVLRLANAGARASATPVPASGSRPAGLALVGVSGLGVGVRDGDVLTDVGGAPASSVVAVVNAVVSARRAHAPAMSGRFWRDGDPWQLTVEMPYVE